LAVVIDVMWVFYIIATNRKKKILAALCSIGIGAPALFGVLSVVENVWFSIPYLLGLGTGTIIGMHLNDRLADNGVQR